MKNKDPKGYEQINIEKEDLPAAWRLRLVIICDEALLITK